jgi:hypothetical protein
MLAAVLRVDRPILHPVPAAAGQFIVWYPGEDLVVFAKTGRGVRLVRRLGFDNAGAIGVQLCDGALTCVYVEGQGQPVPSPLMHVPHPPSSETPRLRLVTPEAASER